MIIYTDDVEFAEKVVPPGVSWKIIAFDLLESRVATLITALGYKGYLYEGVIEQEHIWQYMFVVKQSQVSQYDVLIELAQTKELPPNLLCLTGGGSILHGSKGRRWVSCDGNIHLSVYAAPQQAIDNFGPGFTILPSISVIEAIDKIPLLEGKATIKWVNDVLLYDAKVAGVLTHTLSQGDVVTGVVMGVGVNVETTPVVKRNDFVPRVASLKSFTTDWIACTQRKVAHSLVHALSRNYQRLLDNRYNELLQIYRERSRVIGKDVLIYADTDEHYTDVLAEGVVTTIGENLEIYLEGNETPFRRGRLVMKSITGT